MIVEVTDLCHGAAALDVVVIGVESVPEGTAGRFGYRKIAALLHSTAEWRCGVGIRNSVFTWLGPSNSHLQAMECSMILVIGPYCKVADHSALDKLPLV